MLPLEHSRRFFFFAWSLLLHHNSSVDPTIAVFHCACPWTPFFLFSIQFTAGWCATIVHVLDVDTHGYRPDRCRVGKEMEAADHASPAAASTGAFRRGSTTLILVVAGVVAGKTFAVRVSCERGVEQKHGYVRGNDALQRRRRVKIHIARHVVRQEGHSGDEPTAVDCGSETVWRAVTREKAGRRMRPWPTRILCEVESVVWLWCHVV